jgi:hypothetical protein
MNHGGKGDKPRPFSVSQDEFDNRWENIFGKKKKTEAEHFDEKVVMQEEFYESSECAVKDSEQGG